MLSSSLTSYVCTYSPAAYCTLCDGGLSKLSLFLCNLQTGKRAKELGTFSPLSPCTPVSPWKKKWEEYLIHVPPSIYLTWAEHSGGADCIWSTKNEKSSGSIHLLSPKATDSSRTLTATKRCCHVTSLNIQCGFRQKSSFIYKELCFLLVSYTFRKALKDFLADWKALLVLVPDWWIKKETKHDILPVALSPHPSLHDPPLPKTHIEKSAHIHILTSILRHAHIRSNLQWQSNVTQVLL